MSTTSERRRRVPPATASCGEDAWPRPRSCWPSSASTSSVVADILKAANVSRSSFYFYLEEPGRGPCRAGALDVRRGARGDAAMARARSRRLAAHRPGAGSPPSIKLWLDHAPVMRAAVENWPSDPELTDLWYRGDGEPRGRGRRGDRARPRAWARPGVACRARGSWQRSWSGWVSARTISPPSSIRIRRSRAPGSRRSSMYATFVICESAELAHGRARPRPTHRRATLRRVKKTSIYLEPELDEALARRAADEGLTKAEFIRRRLAALVQRAARPKPSVGDLRRRRSRRPQTRRRSASRAAAG